MAGLAIGLGAAAQAAAATVTFPSSSSTTALEYTQSVDGGQLVVRAYSTLMPSSKNNPFVPGSVANGSFGLGVCNSAELAVPDNPCGSREAPVDNEGRKDWLLFRFLRNGVYERLGFSSATLGQYEQERYQRTYWVGQMSDFSAKATEPDPLSGLAFGPTDDSSTFSNTYTAVSTPPDDKALDVGINARGDFLLLGARANTSADFLFVQSITVEMAPVSAPASLILFGSGLAMLAGLRIRRMR
jgi:hypothetical protein